MYANKTLLEGFEKRPKFQAASNHYINTLKFNQRHIDIVFHWETGRLTSFNMAESSFIDPLNMSIFAFDKIRVLPSFTKSTKDKKVRQKKFI